ncbi:hypothetical protein ACTQ3M_03660 [Oscillospiraceae bacterium LCP25S3_E10]|nr:DUF1963 domain-containing protein [Ruminococcus sp.]
MMSKAIGIKVTKADGNYDLGASKFFGAPVIPGEWQNIFSDTEMFFCQIKCDDIALLDVENRLPHKGYLYVFLDIKSYPFKPRVLYYSGQPTIVVDDFNKDVPGAEHLTNEWLMSFEPADEAGDGIRLLGVPTDWNYAEPAPDVFMQYDPLEADMGFQDSVDGYVYLLFGEKSNDLGDITYREERS